jgi:O-antigen/teichoic acid export membrane protein
MTISAGAPADDITNARARVLSRTRTVAFSAIWNLLGRAGPILVALAATPTLVGELGLVRWGIFTIALSLVGMFGIFDFGLSRALIRSIAERIGTGEEHAAATLVITGLLALAGFGTVGGALAALAAHFWVKHWLHIDAALQGEVLRCLYVLAFSAPFAIMTAAMWSVISAYQKFRTANLINIPLQAFYYIGPVLVLRVWDSLVGVMLVLLLCRLVYAVMYWWLCRRIMPALRGARADLRELGPLLRMGGWMTISNITWPMLMYSDRFIIASVLTAEMTAYYTTPFDVVIRLTLVPIAIMTSAYPAMAVSFRNDPANTANLFRRSLLVIGTMLFPGCLLAASFKTELMATWLGTSFAAHSAPVLRWLIVGILINAMDSAVVGLLDAIGKADVNAKLSVFELIVSIPILMIMLAWLGIEGAAITWVLRCCVDFILRLFIVVRLYRPVRPALALVLPAVMAGICLLALPSPVGSMTLRVGTDIIVMLLYLAVVLRLSVTHDERAQIWAQLSPNAALRRKKAAILH